MSFESIKTLFRWAVPTLFGSRLEDDGNSASSTSSSSSTSTSSSASSSSLPSLLDDPEYFHPSTLSPESSFLTYSEGSLDGSLDGSFSSFRDSPPSVDLTYSALSSSSSRSGLSTNPSTPMSTSHSYSSSSNPIFCFPSASSPSLASNRAKRTRDSLLHTDIVTIHPKRQRNLFPETAKSSVSSHEIASSSTVSAPSELSSSSSLCHDDPFEGLALTSESSAGTTDAIELEFPPTPSSIQWKKTEITSGTSPGPRCWSASCVFQQKLLLLGGYDLLTPYPQGLHVFDPATATWATHALEYPASSPSRYSHTLANVQDRLIIFGGDSLAGYRNDLFELAPDLSVIRPLQARGTPPDPRAAPGHASVGSKLYFSGGDSGNDRGYHNDLYVLHTTTLPFPTWEKITPTTPSPDPRGWHTLSAVKKKLYLFGGYNGNQFFGDMHVYDPVTNAWSSPVVHGKPPSPRHSHAAVVIDDQYIIVVGGVGIGASNFDSVHIFDTTSLSWIEPFIGGAPLPPRHGHSLFYIPELNQIFSFGGYDFTHLYDCFAILPLQHAFKIKAPVCTISTDLQVLVNNQQFSDISFTFQDGSVIWAHKALLSARSEYFRAMFSSFAESKQSQIMLSEISHSVFLSILEYLYTGSTSITPENVFSLLLAANMYNLQGLSSLCQRTFECALSCTSAVSLFEFADSFHAPALKKVVLQFIMKNLKVILQSASFENAPEPTRKSLVEALLALTKSQSSFDKSTLDFLQTFFSNNL